MERFRGLTRREFLKLISLMPVGIHSRPLSKLKAAANSDKPNVIILVFDAWSQHHLAMYGYPRQTMPNLEKFIGNFTIYHNHYSTGTFTVPATSTIFTGMHPWTHRAFQIGAGLSSAHIRQTMFSVVSPTHATLAYTQNKLADQILYQLEPDLDEHVNTWRFNVQNNNLYSLPIFKKDLRMAFASLEDNIVQHGVGFDSSLFFGPLYRLHTLGSQKRIQNKYGKDYPHVLPESPGVFLLGDIVDGAIELLKGIEQPTLAYLHFLPPHEPYAPSKQFFETLMDGWNPPDKPVHPLSEKKTKLEKLHLFCRYYDEFIASWDHEVGRLFQYLNDSGLTKNSYIVVMADHGELFERGDLGHVTRLIYDPVVHVPLMISRPGQTQREDVHTFTSSVDMLPTIAHWTGNPVPDWVEGQLLPKFGGTEDEHRSLFSMDAKLNSSFAPLRNYSISILRDHHRLVYYSYPKLKYHGYEFYDLDADHYELKDLYPLSPSLAREMQDELTQKLSEVNKPFQKNGL